MSKYIKYVREEKTFTDLDHEIISNDIQMYFDSIIERGYEIIYYDEKITYNTINFFKEIRTVVLIGKLNVY